MRARDAVLLALAMSFGTAHAQGFEPSRLAFAVVENAGAPTLILAQRVIDREWGPSDDSIYVERDVPGWRSETSAMALSSVIPGAGQVYAGELQGLWFAVAEAVGWTVHSMLDHEGKKYRNDAIAYAGDPHDSTATWSFARWSQASTTDPAQLETLYAADPTAFYQLIAHEPSLLSGWAGDPGLSRSYFNGLGDQADKRFHGAHAVESGLWVNHLVSAFDALRVARLKNLSLGPALGLRIKSGFSHGRPELAAAFVRTF